MDSSIDASEYYKDHPVIKGNATPITLIKIRKVNLFKETPMQGFWLVQFSGVQGFGGGTVTLINGKVFGGDSAFIYSGSYTEQGSTLNAKIHVKRSFPGMPSVMGQDQFDLELTGTLQGNEIAAAGSIPGTNLRFQAKLTKQGDI